MKTLLIVEHDNHTLNPANFRVCAAACQWPHSVEALIVGWQCDAVVQAARKLPGVQTIRVADAREYEHQLAETMAALIAGLAQDYQVILAVAGTFGKNLMPRVAALLDIAMVSDVVNITAPNQFERYMYAGNVRVTIQNEEPIKILTIRTAAFPAMPAADAQTASIEKIETVISQTHSHFVEQALTAAERPELTTARRIVAGGRGLKSAENFRRLEKLADRLGAAVGASRAAVDAGFAPNDYQIGQTGKIVAPDLYIAFGISGAVQHLAGMRDSRVIVAINNDPDAPIFAAADYKLVMDLFTALEEWESVG
jgi:electron transfer flavoprotein alpha subunit